MASSPPHKQTYACHHPNVNLPSSHLHCHWVPRLLISVFITPQQPGHDPRESGLRPHGHGYMSLYLYPFCLERLSEWNMLSFFFKFKYYMAAERCDWLWRKVYILPECLSPRPVGSSWLSVPLQHVPDKNIWNMFVPVCKNVTVETSEKAFITVQRQGGKKVDVCYVGGISRNPLSV